MGSDLALVGNLLVVRGGDVRPYLRVHIYGIPVVGYLNYNWFGSIRHFGLTWT